VTLASKLHLQTTALFYEGGARSYWIGATAQVADTSDLRLGFGLAKVGLLGSFQSSILKDRGERRASAIRKRVCPGLAIVRDESPDGHRLHRTGEDADRRVIDDYLA
jgi:hypothetical protein